MAAIALVAGARVSLAKPAGRAPVTADSAAPRTSAPFAKGKGSDARNVAFGDVEVFGYNEGISRGQIVTTLRAALGKAPTPAQLEACRIAYSIGRIAAALKDGDGVVAHLASARDVYLHRAAPAKDGVAARKLRKGQTGRRTIEQHKACRAADSAWSLLKAEIAPEQSNAMTQAAKGKAANAKAKAGRAPAMAGSTDRGGAKPAAGTGVTHSELVKPDAPMTADAAVEYLHNMAATLQMFANKHAGVVPPAYGAAVKRFANSLNQIKIDNA